jgi:hypothetical protein
LAEIRHCINAQTPGVHSASLHHVSLAHAHLHKSLPNNTATHKGETKWL